MVARGCLSVSLLSLCLWLTGDQKAAALGRATARCLLSFFLSPLKMVQLNKMPGFLTDASHPIGYWVCQLRDFIADSVRLVRRSVSFCLLSLCPLFPFVSSQCSFCSFSVSPPSVSYSLSPSSVSSSVSPRCAASCFYNKCCVVSLSLSPFCVSPRFYYDC